MGDASPRISLDGVEVAVRLSAHARQRMRERGVDLAVILEALENPCDHAYDKSRDVALSLGCNGVAVVYSLKGRILEVVTVLREREYRYLVHHIGRRRYKRLGPR